MNNTYFGANLVDKNTISVFLFSPIQKNDQTPINLIIISFKSTLKIESSRHFIKASFRANLEAKYSSLLRAF